MTIVGFSGETFFHGSNAVVKGPPWIPSRDGFDPLTSLTAKERRGEAMDSAMDSHGD